MFGSWRDGLEHGHKKAQPMVPVVEFLLASSAELTAVIDPYGNGPSKIVSPEPQKDYNHKDEPEDGAQFRSEISQSHHWMLPELPLSP